MGKQKEDEAMKGFLALLYIGMVLSIGCHRRELSPQPEQGEPSNLTIYVDWSDLEQAQGELPTGMSVFIYPQGGDADEVMNIRSTNINEVSVDLADGRYDILIFNQIPSDFARLQFSGLEAFSTAEVSTELKGDSAAWYDDEVDHSPEYLAAATISNFDFSSSGTSTRCCHCSETSTSQSYHAHPTLVVRRVKMAADVTGAENISSVRAYVDGLADSYNFSTGRSSEKSTTHTIESDWILEPNTRNTDTSTISTIFLSFGAPNDDLSSSPATTDEGKVGLNILLRDQSSIYETGDLNLENRISAAEDETDTHDLLIHLNQNEEAINLPDVENPNEGNESGFDVEIQDWEDTVHIYVPIK